MSRWTILWLQKISPIKRLEWAAGIFWWTVLLGLLSTIFLCHDWFQRILMIISWGAITITAVDIICTSDVRSKEEELK
jgi:hypothetical protein